MYVKPNCPYCDAARRHFADAGEVVEERDATVSPQWREELLRHVAAGAPGVARALARHALDPHAKLSDEDLAPPLSMIDSRSDCADF